MIYGFSLTSDLDAGCFNCGDPFDLAITADTDGSLFCSTSCCLAHHGDIPMVTRDTVMTAAVAGINATRSITDDVIADNRRCSTTGMALPIKLGRITAID